MVADGARPNLFEVTMNFPTFATSGNAQQKFTFMCKSSQLPGATIGSVPVNYFGRELKFAGNRTFTDWTVTIINDEDFLIRDAFEKWMHGINSHITNLRTPSGLRPLDYTRNAQVRQYGKTGGVIKTYNYIGIFPTDVAAIDLDWGSNDSIEEFSVTFAYQWWEQVTSTEVGSGTVSPTTPFVPT
jgi:hypothetical protein